MTPDSYERHLRCRQFYEPPFDRRRFLFFPCTWPFIDNPHGCVIWIDPEWRTLGASTIALASRGEAPSFAYAYPHAWTPLGPAHILHAHVMIPQRDLYRTVRFERKLGHGCEGVLWLDDVGIPLIPVEEQRHGGHPGDDPARSETRDPPGGARR